MAATTLSGFLQCNFLSMDGPMQAHFEALCKTRLPKKRKRELGSVVDTIPSAGRNLSTYEHVMTHSVCCSVVLMETLLLCFCRPGAAPCWCSWVERLYSLQPIRCAHMDAAAIDGPECSPQ